MQDNISGSPAQEPTPMPPSELLILGAGRFGQLAARRLHKRYPEARFLIVDEDRARLHALAEEQHVPVEAQDGVAYLGEALPPADLWIIPAIPVHVAFKWLLASLQETYRAQPLPVPETADALVPNPYRMSSQTLYASYATFICPDHCSEPDDICTHTREPRKGNLFEDLAAISLPGYHTHVLRSWQLCPGIGGYTGSQLAHLHSQVTRDPGSHLIATSCRCHGVIDALEWRRSWRTPTTEPKPTLA